MNACLLSHPCVWYPYDVGSVRHAKLYVLTRPCSVCLLDKTWRVDNVYLPAPYSHPEPFPRNECCPNHPSLGTPAAGVKEALGDSGSKCQQPRYPSVSDYLLSYIQTLGNGRNAKQGPTSNVHTHWPILRDEEEKKKKKKKKEEGSSAIRLWRWGRGLFDTRLLIVTHDSSSYYYQLCPSDVDVVRRVWRGKQNKPPL